jgi:hypothetical protein
MLSTIFIINLNITQTDVYYILESKFFIVWVGVFLGTWMSNKTLTFKLMSISEGPAAVDGCNSYDFG